MRTFSFIIITEGGFHMAIEMRKRPIIKGKDAANFLAKAERNKELMEIKKAQALKKWNEQVREDKN